jgi:hypothetical protein
MEAASAEAPCAHMAMIALMRSSSGMLAGTTAGHAIELTRSRMLAIAAGRSLRGWKHRGARPNEGVVPTEHFGYGSSERLAMFAAMVAFRTNLVQGAGRML